MGTIGDRLKQVTNVLFEGNNAEFARAIGIRPQNMYRYQNEGTIPGGHKLAGYWERDNAQAPTTQIKRRYGDA